MDMLDRLPVERSEYLIEKISENKLSQIIGGSNIINGTFINSLSNLIESLMEVGRSLGSYIRRTITNNNCLR